MTETAPQSPRRNWPADILIGFAVYVVTVLPVSLGLVVGTTPGIMVGTGSQIPLAESCCHYDGSHYANIVVHGYQFNPDEGSSVAFFPAHPLTAWLLAWATGWSAKAALVLSANLALVAVFVVLAAYLRVRNPAEPLRVRLTILGLIGFWPVGFFFRMGYSESLFLLSIALVLLGFARGWSVWVLALLAGATTAVRPVGVAATAAVIASVLTDPARGSLRRRFAVAAGVGFVGCWGLLAYAAYLQARFGDFTVFIQTQKHWAFYEPGPDDIPTKALRLLLLEPVWNAYVPGSSRDWARFDAHRVCVLGLHFWNPLLFLLTAAAVVTGAVCGWLNQSEAILGGCLLLIPYLTRADEVCMGSHARFAAVVIPAFLVAGRALSRSPSWVAWVVFGSLAPLTTVWTALFANAWPMW